MCVNVVVCLLVRLLLPFSAELHGTLGVEISSNNLLRNAIAPDVTRVQEHPQCFPPFWDTRVGTWAWDSSRVVSLWLTAL